MNRNVSHYIFPLFLVLYEIAMYLSNDMYLPALPQMMRDLGLSSQQAQLTLTMWFIGAAVMPLVVGAISDRFGRRKILFCGGIVYIVATIICAMTHDAYILLAARVLQGGMIPTMLVAGYACIHELYEQKQAIIILAFMSSISVLAPALGPLFGGIVLYFLPWRAIFWIITVWTLITLLLLAKCMPETHPVENRKPIQLMSLIKQYWRLFTNKKYMLLMTILGFIFAGFLAWITAGPLLIISSFHYSAIAFGIFQAIVFAVYILGSRLVKYFLEKLGIKSLIQFGLLIASVGGIFILLFAIWYPENIYLFIFSLLAYSLGTAFCFAPLNRLIIETSDEPMGVRVAFFIMCLQGSAVLGSGLASIFFDGTILSLGWLITAAIAISSLVFFVFKPLRK